MNESMIFEQTIDPVAKTDRLTIYRSICEPWRTDTNKCVYWAFDRQDDHPAIACSAVVSNRFYRPESNDRCTDPSVLWIETSNVCRRRGYATELLEAIEKIHGRLNLGGATPSGKKFVNAFESRKRFAAP